MQAQVEELAENKIRLTVEVPPGDVRHAIDHAAAELAESVKIPGFRKGKVPMQVLVSRIGKERVYSEAVESHITGWFRNAAARSRVRPVEAPEYDYELPAGTDESWSFTATFSVQPKPEPADWTALEVPYAEPAVPGEMIDAELERLRFGVAELAPVEGRPAQRGDTLVVDLGGPSGGTQRDTVVELGAGRMVEELEAGLVGMAKGESKEIEYELNDGATSKLTVTVTEIREPVLPPADDGLARAASEFDTLAELRADIEARLREQVEAEGEATFREAALDQLVQASRAQVAGPLVESRTRALLEGVVRSLERRGISVETYLSITGKTPEEFIEGLRIEASHAVARELVLEAVADKLGLEVGDEEIRELIREQEGEDAEAVIEDVFAHGAGERLREDLRLRAALDRVTAEVKRIDPELHAAREKLWTPEQEKPQTAAKLWTPGSKENA